MLSRFKLGVQFTLILVVVFSVGVAISLAVLWRVLEGKAEAEVTERSVVLLETMNAVRGYTSAQVNPLLAERLHTEADFIPETVPAYSAREVFEGLRSDVNYEDFFYKEATLNPTNPRDQADEFETGLVEQFRSEGHAELSGFRTVNGQRVFYNARPMEITSQACLSCHGDPIDAPASLISTYGDEAGFGWEMNEIVAAQIIYVPAENVIGRARNSLFVVMGIFSAVFGIVILLTNFLLQRAVINPVTQMGAFAQKLSDDALDDDDLEEHNIASIASRTDEVGQSARIFQKMAREVQQREQSLRRKVQELTIIIDEGKKDKEVKAITESEYFQELQEKVKTMRKRSTQEVKRLEKGSNPT